MAFFMRVESGEESLVFEGGLRCVFVLFKSMAMALGGVFCLERWEGR